MNPRPVDPAATAPDRGQAAHRRYWRFNQWLTGLLLLLWGLLSFVLPFFARDLNFIFFGWPFSFWAASQGALMLYVLIVACYALVMNWLDHHHGVAEVD